MDTALITRALLSFCVVLGMIGLFWLGLKRWGSRITGVLPQTAAASRLRVVEARALGPKHRLVLVRRDTAEHLLLLTPEGAAVVETGIKADDR